VLPGISDIQLCENTANNNFSDSRKCVLNKAAKLNCWLRNNNKLANLNGASQKSKPHGW
jgi:hypothetical protein